MSITGPENRKSGEEYLELEPRMSLISETSYNEEMKKHTIRGKLFAIIGKTSITDLRSISGDIQGVQI